MGRLCSTHRSVIIVFCIAYIGLYFGAAGTSYAGISYCGPVSYKYTRNFQWQMDYTSKQGKNHKQVKEEKKIFDGEFYICLSGRMLGNTGMFDGEHMQQDYTYSEIDNWLDQKTSEGSTSGKKHNNASLPGGQQGYMRGSLLLDCPEGNELPGRKCRYTLNLTFGTGYVFQARQETFASGDQPPENFTMSTPLVFSRPVLLEDKPVTDGWSIEDSLTRDIKVEEKADECVMVLRQPHIDNCSYTEKETASWDLKRTRGPCDAYVSKFKGDVKINGKPVSGIVDLAKGDVIRTGDHSKIQVTVGLGDNYYIGSDTEFTMVDPCKNFAPTGRKATMRIIGGKLRAIVMDLVGAEGGFEIRTGTAVMGVRGEVPNYNNNRFIALLKNLFSETTTAEAATLPDDIPNIGTRVADIIFSVEVIPEEKVTVEVFKGSLLVKDNKGSRQKVVKENQTVSSWEDGSAFEDVTITNASD